MNSRQILDLYDQEMRRDPPSGQAQVHRREDLTFVTMPPPSPFAGWVLYTRLDEANADVAIQEAIEFFRPVGGEFEWKTYEHDTPTDLKQRLQRFGFVPDEVEGLLALNLEAAPKWLLEKPAVNLRRVDDPAELAPIADIENEVWNEFDPDRLDYLTSEKRANPDGISFYLAYADNRPVSCAWIRFYPERSFAELYGGSTLPAYRRRGLYRALVSVRALEARSRGVRFLAVDTSPMSRPILQKIGFQFLCYTQPYVWKF